MNPLQMHAGLYKGLENVYDYQDRHRHLRQTSAAYHTLLVFDEAVTGVPLGHAGDYLGRL